MPSQFCPCMSAICGRMVREPPIFSTLIVPTAGGHIGPPLQQCRNVVHRHFGGVNVQFTSFYKIHDKKERKNVNQSPPVFPIRRRGGPMCPPGRNAIRFPLILGEFVVPTSGGHTGPPLRPIRKCARNPLLPWRDKFQKVTYSAVQNCA